ncbi:hypothetical protein [Bordetella phage vB_BbrM_PHB04]|uniref:Phage tail collar domain-containing protein n=1 Tax=Bordetella phage vB_BbrM_PHB04 TaxID=2029657 RepID=A0A291L9Y1_9CAUD|nr:hypothetical protein HOS14_gp053 [Bordetella phage vB_BbrM_PHB04]ATI15671.1 hypothetical protein [Bordetella phage vB_BbrM_PHB04]
MNRRGFLKSLAGAAAVGALPGLSFSSARALTRSVDPLLSGLPETDGQWPVGVVMPWATRKHPGMVYLIKCGRAKWELAYGQDLHSSAYPELFEAIGHSYGGSGKWFRVPDLRGQFILPAGRHALTTRHRVCFPTHKFPYESCVVRSSA